VVDHGYAPSRRLPLFQELNRASGYDATKPHFNHNENYPGYANQNHELADELEFGIEERSSVVPHSPGITEGRHKLHKHAVSWEQKQLKFVC
jgi:hypothetical protein